MLCASELIWICGGYCSINRLNDNLILIAPGCRGRAGSSPSGCLGSGDFVEVHCSNKEAIEETIQDLCSKKKTRESDFIKFFGLNHTI